MELLINGQARTFPALASGARLAELVGALALKSDRVAIEQNGQIVRRQMWETTVLTNGDRIEIVHFVGGGAPHLPVFPGCPELSRRPA